MLIRHSHSSLLFYPFVKAGLIGNCPCDVLRLKTKHQTYKSNEKATYTGPKKTTTTKRLK